MHARRPTRQIHVGSVAVGGGAPITVQSMTTTKTADVDGTLAQIYALTAAGADIVRCTCNEEEAAEGLARIVPRSPVPLVASAMHELSLFEEVGFSDVKISVKASSVPVMIDAYRLLAETTDHPLHLG